MTTVAPQPEIERDRFGRPLIQPVDGGKRVAYTRATTFAGALSDQYRLGLWKQRMTATGLLDRPDLILAVAAARHDSTKLDAVCESAVEAAKGTAAAGIGTSLHTLTEMVDRGIDVGTIPDAYVADLAAYQKATEELTALHIEQICVQDFLKVAGTPDRIVNFRKKTHIADLKSGSIQWDPIKIAAQLAIYARSKIYDVATGERTPHGAEIDWGIVIHAPAGTGTCTLYWVDLLKGWEAVLLARQVRDMRAISTKHLLKPVEDTSTWSVEGPPPPGGTVLPPAPPVPPTDAVRPHDPTLDQLIGMATTVDEVRALWRTHADEWTDELTGLAKNHIAHLMSASSPT